MKHIVINNFGPLTKADVHLQKIKEKVGSQNSGKELSTLDYQLLCMVGKEHPV